MSSDQDRIEFPTGPPRRGVVNRRRREKQDTLLADEPPRPLGIAIVATAILLLVAGAFAWSIKYQETTPVEIEITAEPGTARPVGAAYLPIEEASQITTGETVTFELDGYPAANYGRCEGKIASASIEKQNDAVMVTIDLPAGLATSSGFHPPLDRLNQPGAFRGRGEVLTKKVRLCGKLFGVFRTLFDRK
ncbi:MAG: hypothetical protein ACREDR_35950 [Blastocatellia bacterium]